MQAMKSHRTSMSALVFVLGLAWTTGACMGDIGALGSTGSTGTSSSGCPISTAEPQPEPPSDCSMPAAPPCMRYRIQLDGDVMDPVVRAKYIAKFGSACYVSEANTFDCFYKDPQKACDDGVLVPEVIGATPHDKGYPCLQVVGTDNYWRQTGSDPAIKIDITFAPAPRETPLIDVNGVPTAVNGPYRDVPEPPTVKVGGDFDCTSGMFNAAGKSMQQREYLLEVNKKAHGGVIQSDLAGFTYPCKDACGKPMICTEPLVLNGAQYTPNEPQVHHVVRKTDKRSCPWGTNSNRNAVVISGRLNRVLRNTYPLATEVLQVNQVPPYTP